MSGDLDLDAIEARAAEALSHHAGKRWVVDEESDNTDVRANLGAGPTVCTTIPLGYDIRRANAAHIASVDPATTLAMVAEVRRLRAQVEQVRALAETKPGATGRALYAILDAPAEDRA